MSEPDHEPPKPAPSRDEGATKNPYGSETDTMMDNLAVVEHSFDWYANRARERVHALRSDIDSEDELPVEAFAVGLLDTFLAASAAGLAKYMVIQLAHHRSEVVQEFMKTAMKHGFEEGIAKGREALRKPEGSESDRFIDAQDEALRDKYRKDQNEWLRFARHKVSSKEDAVALANACNSSDIEREADRHYELARDAWVSYVAQKHYGARDEHRQPVAADDGAHGKTTTNMDTQGQRNRTNKGLEHPYVPADAPTFRNTYGVLTMQVELPEIEGNEMHGSPKITPRVEIDGINKKIREQYSNHSLADAHIPRVVIATVHGANDFMLYLDETGENQYWMRHDDSEWLRARATVGHPENESKSDLQKEKAGMQLLLESLIVPAIPPGQS